MRVFVFLLVLANLLFFVWTQGYLGSSNNPDALRLQQQLRADQVTIVSRGEPPALPDKADKARKVETLSEKPAEKNAVPRCLIWADLLLKDADRLENLLSEKFSAFKENRTETPGSATYWVFIPPLASRQEADKKAVELKKLGAPEFYIVQDAGPNHLAISLGIFSSEEAARERLETLRAKGIKSARSGERSVKQALATLEVVGPEAQYEVLREAALLLLPEVKPATCKPRATPAQ
jgi:cell division septation protein DedD